MPEELLPLAVMSLLLVPVPPVVTSIPLEPLPDAVIVLSLTSVPPPDIPVPFEPETVIVPLLVMLPLDARMP